ncbi:damage-inducible protein DinB [Bhargavaea cecembensis]|uniref:Damage-inducible protein DinB n=1 Tax=Bhargavaea cecembensis TaxID=394098 RepID=A0A165GPK2_9BACL|nr:DinB family protein [Bhargavaea cecembensis]KZE37194.1 damage-inducible protein DinB [Bhargavaea cecembensis]
MIPFFEYNWQVRDEWFAWCSQLPEEELIRFRTGGVGSFLKTLFHIIDVEYSWIRGIQGKEDIVFDYAGYDSLEKVQSLSDRCRSEVIEFLKENREGRATDAVRVPWDDEKFTVGEVLHHLIAHEIHHIGQLSVWARELDLTPVSAHYAGRTLKPFVSYES